MLDPADPKEDAGLLFPQLAANDGACGVTFRHRARRALLHRARRPQAARTDRASPNHLDAVCASTVRRRIDTGAVVVYEKGPLFSCMGGTGLEPVTPSLSRR